MQDHKPRPKFLRRPTSFAAEFLIALVVGSALGAVLFFHF